jgi:MFS transporter, FHS family, L-fucose permease
MKAISKIPPILVIGLLFFVFGFVTWLGSVLIPYLQIACGLNTFQSYFVAFAFYISYTLMAIPASMVLKKTGLKNGMSVGLSVMAIGALVFIPAAMTRMYSLFLLGLFIQGAGLTLLQTAANPYITILGPIESAAKRISIMGICNGIAGMLAPLILGSVILKDTDTIVARVALMTASEKNAELNELANRVVLPYALMMVSLACLALLIRYAGLPAIDPEEEDEVVPVLQNRKTSIWQFPHLLLGVLTLFMYVGVEVIAVDTITGFASSQGIPLTDAKFFASFTLFNMLLGYILGIICIPRYIRQETALRISAIAGITFSLLSIFSSGVLSVSFIALLGLANALIWPSIWPLAIDGLGRFTKTGSSLLVMGIGGGALLPLAYGKLADQFTPHHAYWIVLPCYLMILYYAVRGHKAGIQPIKELI